MASTLSEKPNAFFYAFWVHFRKRGPKVIIFYWFYKVFCIGFSSRSKPCFTNAFLMFSQGRIFQNCPRCPPDFDGIISMASFRCPLIHHFDAIISMPSFRCIISMPSFANDFDGIISMPSFRCHHLKIQGCAETRLCS